jgi:integrase
MRVVSLDPDTITILTAHKQQVQRRCTELGITLDAGAFVFSYAPDHRRHCDPDGITHRCTKMTADLGIDPHLHALRHYEVRASHTAAAVSAIFDEPNLVSCWSGAGAAAGRACGVV